MTVGLIRFDVEDFLTPESDWALDAMMSVMRSAGLPASYGIVGKKAVALKERGQEGILARLREEPALGFHSTGHSEHPTIAEELADLPYAEAVDAFVARERIGVDAVARLIKAPLYFTQPGANWVPEAAHALPRLGIGTYFSDSWNSYLVTSPQPVWYGDVLHLAPPVIQPRPFLLGMPGNLRQAITMVEQVPDDLGDEDLFMIMLHPTELVTREFWDAVNYGGGRTVYPLRPGPLRTKAEQEAALASFRVYVESLARISGIDWTTVAEVARRVSPRGPVAVGKDALVRQILTTGIGPMTFETGSLSAADVVWAAARLAADPGRTAVSVAPVQEPLSWTPQEENRFPALSASAVGQLCRELIAHVKEHGRLPDRVGHRLGFVGPEWVLRYALALLTGHEPSAVTPVPVPLTFLSYVKAPENLHWSWPIFPPGFRPFRLWQDARRLAWGLTPARRR